MEAMAGALLDAQVDLNPHQIDAAMFATSNPLSKGVILADEVGLGKTIEAGLLIAQRWAERKRRILIITPANLRKQWHQELADKFGLPATIIEAKSFRQAVKDGAINPFNQPGIIICSYQFAARRSGEVKAVAWDLVVIDEAHRLRNVYKPENKTARALQEALSHPQKVLLTATPLQNSLLELYGLVSFIDERVFGDLDSFKSQFASIKNAESFDALKNRIAHICKRTLRRQVEAYVKYTRRIPLLREFSPGADETALYDNVTEYLERESLHALPNSQRQLITLVLRKLLASSTFAIAGALETLINRLKKTLAEKSSTLGSDDSLVDELDEDFESLDEIADEIELQPADETKARTQEHIHAIKQEISDLESFRQLAVSITENSKGTALLQALKVAFAKLDELGAAKKAIIFTESRRTQDYLMNLLAKTPYGQGVVLFNGTNNDDMSKRIYTDWIKRHAGSDRITGSRSADTRAALVEHFREFNGADGSIMIATEAGAEGINLQFCSMVINYDLPWNPQRIEQRIGRCHRYGQKHDVVVVNFLNRENEADKRVYELLDLKFRLFEGVFGASDEVLGAVESGVDFERRIAEIYQTCRQPAAIHTAFEQLQLDMAGEISDAMLRARKSLLENFDEDVQERLRLRSQDAKASLGKLERLLMRFTSGALEGHAEFADDETSFVLKTTPSFLESVSLDEGRYELPRRSEDAHIYRLGHPLAQALLQHAKQQSLVAAKLVLDYAAYGAKVSVVEPLRGQQGWVEVRSLQIRSLGEVEEHLLVAAIDAKGNVFDEQVTERLLNLPCASNVPVEAGASEHRPSLEAEIERQKMLIVADLETRNLGAFTQETEKLDAWADDLKVGLERDIKDLDRHIKESRTKSKGAATLADKLDAQKEQRDLEGQRDKKRRELFERQDEIQRKRDGLIDELERQLKQEIHIGSVMAFEWELI
ncbi:MAG: SNF2-related protein [Anaerolineales bacterium]|nr:SNF2-related protein [Anaerolineales bacterium]